MAIKHLSNIVLLTNNIGHHVKTTENAHIVAHTGCWVNTSNVLTERFMKQKNINNVTDGIRYIKFVYIVILICLCYSVLSHFITLYSILCRWFKKGNIFKHLSANPTKWSKTHKKFVGNRWLIVWVCLTILWGWLLKF